MSAFQGRLGGVFHCRKPPLGPLLKGGEKSFSLNFYGVIDAPLSL